MTRKGGIAELVQCLAAEVVGLKLERAGRRLELFPKIDDYFLVLPLT